MYGGLSGVFVLFCLFTNSHYSNRMPDGYVAIPVQCSGNMDIIICIISVRPNYKMLGNKFAGKISSV